jgi:hypothetical protein
MMGMKNYYIIVFFLVCWIGIRQCLAQDHKNVSSNSLSVGVNSDAFMGLGIGYLRGSALSGIPISYYFNLNVPLLSSVMQMKLDTWELEAGATLEPIRKNWFIFRTDGSLFAMKHTQQLGTFIPLGIALKLTPAYHLNKGYIGFQVMFKQVLVTHIHHSAYVREKFREIYSMDSSLSNKGPQNGFYAFTGRSLYLGIEGMFQVSSRADIYFDLGMIDYLSKYTGLLDAMMFGQIPIYTSIQLNYRIGNK